MAGLASRGHLPLAGRSPVYAQLVFRGLLLGSAFSSEKMADPAIDLGYDPVGISSDAEVAFIASHLAVDRLFKGIFAHIGAAAFLAMTGIAVFPGEGLRREQQTCDHTYQKG